ncbi:MFS general substrate transporter [Lepidopterella palustris CBS 459.81]|uniref:MFS general substrate transporter n=1 Tax=Lepidopterella palustris CBS 459.81 TaxID=1314670 RepID=A0A8E2E4W5_9PEZI|nr:MFS general substrate transporter [Lepidopterella palustris CBS 459.81]
MTEAAASATEQSPLILPNSASSTPSISSISKSSRTLADSELNRQDEPAQKISALRGALVVTSIGLLIFLQATNISILTTTQSAIAADLNAFEKVSWLTSSYLIAVSSISPLSGRLCQLFSPRLCMFVSTIIVCIGSAITSLSSSFEVFVLGRAVTGAGAAGILIVATIIAIQMAGAKNRGLYIGLINSGMTVGVSLGAVIAGAVEPKFGWKILFGIQSPISLGAGLCLLFGLPAKYIASRGDFAGLPLRQKLARVDYFGAISLTTTILLFLLGLSGPRILPTPIILSLLLFPLFVINESRFATDPIIPIAVLRSRGTLLTCLGTVGFMMARWSVLFFTPVYALAIRNWSPAVAGSILIPTNAGFALGGLLAGLFHIRRTGSFYVPSLVSMGLFPVTLLALALTSVPSTPATAYVVLVFLNGLFTGAALNYTLVHALHLTPASVHPIVLALIATFRGFAGSFGSAIGGGFFMRILYKALVEGFQNAGLKHKQGLVRKLMGSPALVRGLDSTDREVAVSAYEIGIRALFLAGMGLSVVMVLIQAGTGWRGPGEDKENGAGVVEGEGVGEGEVGGEQSLIGGS